MASSSARSAAEIAGARAPVPTVLAGVHVRVEPLDPSVHGDGLWAAASAGDPALWDHLPYGPFGDAEAFRAWLDGLAVDRPDARFHAIVRVADDAPAGMIAFARIAPEIGRIEIAHVWFGAELQRTPGATEAVLLLAAHAFDDLGNRRLEWKCDARNVRSRRAAERLGFTYEGTFRQDLIVKAATGTPRGTRCWTASGHAPARRCGRGWTRRTSRTTGRSAGGSRRSGPPRRRADDRPHRPRGSRPG